MKRKQLKLYKIEATSYKTFYVFAESQTEALEADVVDEEADPNWHTKVPWERDTILATEVGSEDRKRVEDDPRRAKLIVKEER